MCQVKVAVKVGHQDLVKAGELLVTLDDESVLPCSFCKGEVRNGHRILLRIIVYQIPMPASGSLGALWIVTFIAVDQSIFLLEIGCVYFLQTVRQMSCRLQSTTHGVSQGVERANVLASLLLQGNCGANIVSEPGCS